MIRPSVEFGLAWAQLHSSDYHSVDIRGFAQDGHVEQIMGAPLVDFLPLRPETAQADPPPPPTEVAGLGGYAPMPHHTRAIVGNIILLCVCVCPLILVFFVG